MSNETKNEPKSLAEMNAEQLLKAYDADETCMCDDCIPLRCEILDRLNRAESAKAEVQRLRDAAKALVDIAETVCNWIGDDSQACHDAHAQLQIAIGQMSEALTPTPEAGKESK
jgi:hypothetical protein